MLDYARRHENGIYYVKELFYRDYLISDEETMSYNMGYGDNGGCTYHKTSEERYAWHQYWKTPDRLYAYIQ